MSAVAHSLIPPQIKQSLLKVFEREVVPGEQEVGHPALEVPRNEGPALVSGMTDVGF